LGAALVRLADRLLFDARQEALDDVELDVGLEQRQAHVAQRLLDVLLGQLSDAREPVFRGTKAFAEGFEHGSLGWPRRCVLRVSRRSARFARFAEFAQSSSTAARFAFGWKTPRQVARRAEAVQGEQFARCP